MKVTETSDRHAQVSDSYMHFSYPRVATTYTILMP
uniref:Uncharacterized protein n=1 Tax=Anguilla anguilla TaxID=7936 RepID=A0A0E9U9H9_ANGAN